jgi:hypothetical protein
VVESPSPPTETEADLSYQAYLDAIEKKTGKTPQELLSEAERRGFTSATKAAEVVAWLAEEYGVGRGHAMAFYGVLKNGSTISDKHVGTAGTHRDELDGWLC